MQIFNPPSSGGSAAQTLAKGDLWGLISSLGTDTDHDLDFTVGAARDYTDSVDIELETAITKQFDSAWAVGDDAGGLLSGTLTANGIFGVWLIRRSDTGVVDIGAEEDLVLPDDSITFPTDYDSARLIGFFNTDGSANIIAFDQIGDWFIYRDGTALRISDTTITDETFESAASSFPGFSFASFWTYAANDNDNLANCTLRNTSQTLARANENSLGMITDGAATPTRLGALQSLPLASDGLIEYAGRESAGTAEIYIQPSHCVMASRSNPYCGA